MIRIVLTMVAFAAPKLVTRPTGRPGRAQLPATPTPSNDLDVDGYKSILGGLLSSRG